MIRKSWKSLKPPTDHLLQSWSFPDFVHSVHHVPPFQCEFLLKEKQMVGHSAHSPWTPMPPTGCHDWHRMAASWWLVEKCAKWQLRRSILHFFDFFSWLKQQDFLDAFLQAQHFPGPTSCLRLFLFFLFILRKPTPSSWENREPDYDSDDEYYW